MDGRQPHPGPHYLLIMACSQRKRRDATLLPAIERYDGPSFQVLRKWQRARRGSVPLTILVLSAEFGLIPATRPLPWYEHRLTPAQSADPQWQAAIARCLQPYLTPPPAAIFLHLGRTYWHALARTPLGRDASLPIIRPPGGIGQKLAALRRWLTEIAALPVPSSPV